MTASLRRDLLLGTVYGLAMSVIVWCLVFTLPVVEPGILLAMTLSVAAGATWTRLARRGRFVVAYPVALASLLLFGPGPSCLAGPLCTLGALLALAPAGRRSLRQAGYRISRVTLACSAAAAGYFLTGGPPAGAPVWPPAGLPLVAHAVAFSMVDYLLTRLTLAGIGRATIRHLSLGTLSRSVRGYAIGVAAAIPAAAAYTDTGAKLALLSAAALCLTWAFHRMAAERRRLTHRHREVIRELCRAVTRSLTQAMEARDESTQNHLRRVRRLAVEVGERLGLHEPQLEALSAAALLHDIGKFAVPEGILSKPGRLSAAEMEQVKVHPVVGANVLEGIPFPQPVASTVLYHHERWDGCGYPSGLKGEAIPLAARILSVVDTYDALTSERPYRKALSHRDTLDYLRREAGAAFDPDVVGALLEHLDGRIIPELPEAMREAPDLVLRGAFQEETVEVGRLSLAQRELQTLYDIARAMDYGLSLEEYLTLVGCHLATLIPHQSLVVYTLDREEHLLRASFAMGKAADRLHHMTIPLGERLSGWSALQQQALIGEAHVSPMDRDGSRSDLEEWSEDEEVSSLTAALTAPMVIGEQVVGVLTLYDQEGRRYTSNDRRILVRVAGYAAQVIDRLESGLGACDQPTLTDPLTGVPNARFLWLESAQRIERTESPGFGLLAFRVEGLEQVGERCGNASADQLLCRIARRFANECAESETLVRFGPDLFMVLTPLREDVDLGTRWHELAERMERPLELGDGAVHRVRLKAAYASYPDDGDDLESILKELDTRLSEQADRGCTVVPFRRTSSARVRT